MPVVPPASAWDLPTIDPPENSRENLGELARASRIQREAAAAGRLRATRRNQTIAAARHEREDQLMTYATWKSLSVTMALVYWAVFASFLAAVLTGLDVVPTLAMFAVFAVSLALLIAAGLATFGARRRDLAFRAALPYPTHGYASVLGHAARSAECIVEFTSTRPPSRQFADTLQKLSVPTTLIAVSGEQLTVKCEPAAPNILDDHARWFPKWFRNFNDSVLQPLHKAHPIRSLTFR